MCRERWKPAGRPRRSPVYRDEDGFPVLIGWIVWADISLHLIDTDEQVACSCRGKTHRRRVGRAPDPGLLIGSWGDQDGSEPDSGHPGTLDQTAKSDP